MAADQFRWGVLGPGRIARKFARDLDTVDGATLHAVASRDAARSRLFAEEYGAEVALDSYEALIEDNEVEAVYIATPHRYHFKQALMCLKAGKPVLCEKPLTVNATEARKLIDTARANDTFLMEALWSRYLPIWRRVRTWIDEGAIGDTRLVTSTFGFRAPRNLLDRHLNHELAGGALLDLGVYNIALTQWVLRRNPSSLAARSIIGETNVDEMTTANLYYDNSVASQFVCTFLVQTGNEMAIYGTDGSIRVHPQFWGATRATLSRKDEERTVTLPHRSGGFEYQTEEAMRCIAEGLPESPSMTHAATLANMELMDNIRAEVGLEYSFES